MEHIAAPYAKSFTMLHIVNRPEVPANVNDTRGHNPVIIKDTDKMWFIQIPRSYQVTTCEKRESGETTSREFAKDCARLPRPNDNDWQICGREYDEAKQEEMMEPVRLAKVGGWDAYRKATVNFIYLVRLYVIPNLLLLTIIILS